MANTIEDLEYTKCYFCGKDNTTFLYSIKGIMDDQRRFNIVKCNICSLVYINPRYSESENYGLYQEAYFSEKWPDPSGKVRSFINDRERKISDHKIEVGYIKKYKRGGRILDFGSATGFFLEAIDGDWEKYAVDISKFAIDNIRDPSVNKFHGTLLEANYNDNFFDVIYVGHTLDRLINLRERIIELKRILKSGGIILITLPNIDSLCSIIFKNRFRLLYSNHIVYFSPKTLKKLFNEAGLNIIEIKYPFYKTSFFSWTELPKNIIKIVVQSFLNIFGVNSIMISPPFWRNIMTVIIKANHA